MAHDKGAPTACVAMVGAFGKIGYLLFQTVAGTSDLGGEAGRRVDGTLVCHCGFGAGVIFDVALATLAIFAADLVGDEKRGRYEPALLS